MSGLGQWVIHLVSYNASKLHFCPEMQQIRCMLNSTFMNATKSAVNSEHKSSMLISGYAFGLVSFLTLGLAFLFRPLCDL